MDGNPTDALPRDVVLAVVSELSIDARRALGVYTRLRVPAALATLLNGLNKKLLQVRTDLSESWAVALQRPDSVLRYSVSREFMSDREHTLCHAGVQDPCPVTVAVLNVLCSRDTRRLISETVWLGPFGDEPPPPGFVVMQAVGYTYIRPVVRWKCRTLHVVDAVSKRLLCFRH